MCRRRGVEGVVRRVVSRRVVEPRSVVEACTVVSVQLSRERQLGRKKMKQKKLNPS